MSLVFLFLILVLSLYALASRDLLHGVIALSGVSLVSAILFYLFKAPDVAITEAAVGAGVSTVIFVWAIRNTERKARKRHVPFAGGSPPGGPSPGSFPAGAAPDAGPSKGDGGGAVKGGGG